MRLQGKVKLGFYPTPPPVVEALARLVAVSERYARVRLLDPCAGDGKALARFSEHLKTQHAATHGRYASCQLETYGIEIQPLLAQEAEARLNHVLQTSFFTTTLSHGDASDHGWQCLYLNPPYDFDVNAESGKKKEREELQFLRRATLLLCPGGLLIFIIPQHVLGRPEVVRFLSQHYDEHRCLRFPDAPWTPAGTTIEVSMYGQFQQVVFFGRKRPKAIPYHAQDAALQALETRMQQWAALGHQLEALLLEPHAGSALSPIPNAPPTELRSFLKGSFDPDAVAASVGQLLYSRTKRPRRGVWASQDYWSARFPTPQSAGLSVGHPLHRFKRGYLIVFAVAGLLNHAVLVGKDGRRVLVKGHTRKVIRYSCREDEHEKVEKETECFESSLWCTDLDSGDLTLIETGGEVEVSWDVLYDTMDMKSFLENFGDSIMEQVMALNTPRYTSSRQVPWAAHGFSLLKRKPLGKQMDIILAQVHASVNRWQAEGSNDAERVMRIAEIAEMASGKTYMSICTAFLSDLYACGASELAGPGTKRLSSFPAIVLTPPIMAPKWKRELEQTLPNARVLIVERFGSAREPGEEEDDDEEMDRRQAQKSFSDAASAFRQFDPHFSGTSLGTIGSVDRAVACIEAELAQWKRDYDRVAQENRDIRYGTRQGSVQPLPLKPCHVLILTFNTAKMMPQWMPVYQLKPLRLWNKDTGKIQLLRRPDGTPVLVPSCPSCGRAVKDEQLVRRELARSDSAYREFLNRLQTRRQARADKGQELGRQLNICEERLQQMLAEQPAYAVLLAERAALQAELHRHMASFEEHVAAVAAQTPAGQRWKPVLQQQQANEQATHALRQQLDGCETRIQSWLTQFEHTHEPYAQLLRERDVLRGRIAHQPHRIAAYEVELAESVSLYLPESGLQGKKDHRVKRRCTECGEPLWQYVAKKPKVWTPFGVSTFLPVLHEVRWDRGVQRQYTLGTHHVTPLPLPERDSLPRCVTTTYQRRWAIADYIADQYPHVFKYLIADEVHEGADGTALDQARQVLTSACGRMIGLTGTLSNGYASSLFRLFYLIIQQVRERYPYEGVKQWIRDHGKMQTIQKSKYEEETQAGSGSDSKCKIVPGLPVYREIAGFDPTGMGLVAQRSTFTELRDVVSNLVGYKEDLCFVKMEEPLGSAYLSFERTITAKLGELLARGDKSALSPWYTALLIYPDMPWLGWTCETNKGTLLGKAPALPEDMVYPLERALIDYVQKQHDQGYPVLVYTENSGTYDDQDRLKYLFETKVRGKDGSKLKVAILRTSSTKKTMDREAWLERCVEQGVDVLICNPALVKVGLDLLHFKRIAYKRTPRKVSDLRQSSRRSLRPGQDTDIEVMFFAYEQSMALRLLSLMARKAYASLVVEGKLPSEGLVSLGFQEEEEEGDLMGRMARDMLAELKQGTLGQGGNVAEELQDIVRRSIEIEHRQNLEVGEEDIAARIVLEEIRTEPVHVSASFYEPTPPPTPTLEAAETQDTAARATPVAEPAATVPVVDAVPLEVTIVPISVTEDPWASAIKVQASQSVWDVLRQQLGPKKRVRRK